MKTLIMTFNAKYIHTSLALRLLKANTTHPCDMREFTIKESIDDVIEQVKHYDVIGVSVYIWNVETTLAFVKRLKAVNPAVFIVLGGPEVTYDSKAYVTYVDAVIKGEGEVAFDALLTALKQNLPLNTVPHITTLTIDNPFHELDVSRIALPYALENDYANRINYIETSRGCPYLCSYCMASLEKKVRYFPIEQIKNAILDLIDKGARTFKFLDRTFNTHVDRTLDFFHFLYGLTTPGLSFQFEITGDLLHPKIIKDINTYAPTPRIRFEIGIQSTNYETNLLVRRIQNNSKLFQNILALQSGKKVDLHLDLIAGLPKEDISSFEKTFNDVIALRPKELQLGFLKCLKGTQLASDAPLYGYVFDTVAPYEIVQNDALSKEDIAIIKEVEYVLNVFYNKSFFPTFMPALLDTSDNPFSLFRAIYRMHNKKHHYQLRDLALTLDAYVSSNYPELRKLLLFDYLNYHDVKPPLYLSPLPKSVKNHLLKTWHLTHLANYSIDTLYKYSLVTVLADTYFVAIYLPDRKEILSIQEKRTD